MLSPERAWEAIEELLQPLSSAPLAIREARASRLASPIVATTEVPPFDAAALDGYAYSGERSPGSILTVAGVIAAGAAPGQRLAAGEAVRIFTGAPVPEGADRVVGVENTDEPAPGTFRLLVPAGAGAAIRRRAEVIDVGQPLLAPGDRLSSAALALLASQGIDRIDVVRRPRVAVLATGDEVVPASAVPRPGQLRDSHTDYLMAEGIRLGAEVVSLDIADDDPEALAERTREGLRTCDVLLVCGGVSMGGRDHTRQVLEQLGARTVFHGVAVQPGKPLLFAHLPERWIFGLPGNPASVMVAFRLFVEPALARLAGDARARFWGDARPALLAGGLPAGKSRDRFVPARFRESTAAGELLEPLAVRGSHDLATFARADRLLRIRAGEAARPAGDAVEALDWT